MSPGFPPRKPAARPPMGPGDIDPIGGPPAPTRPPKPDVQPPNDQPDTAPKTGVTLDMLSYHGEDERCDGCSHFQGPDKCDIDPSTPVTPGGHCQAFAAGGQQGDEPEAADDSGEEDSEYQ